MADAMSTEYVVWRTSLLWLLLKLRSITDHVTMKNTVIFSNNFFYGNRCLASSCQSAESFSACHLPGRPPAHQTTYDDNRRPVG